MSINVIVIGGGIAGLSAACCLAKAGCKVTLLEKNAEMGGRLRQHKAAGFTFDMGPTWYWMPDIIESFFNQFGFSASGFYELVRLNPMYRVYFGKDDFLDVPAALPQLCEMFEKLENGSSLNLRQFLKEGEYKYAIGMKKFALKPGLSLLEYADPRLLKDALQLHIFQSMSDYIRKYFHHPRLIQILEFPVLFLGAKPSETPALYSLMNYADMCLGSWYPMGGMFKIIEGMTAVAQSLGVTMMKNCEVEKINVHRNSAAGVTCNGSEFAADAVVGSADYHHVDQKLLDKPYRNYSPRYWDSRVLSPSCLIFYTGINKKLMHLQHHNLFFDADFDRHQREIYDSGKWPAEPLFYACCPSKTDPLVAPPGMEALFVLIPVAVGLDDSEETRERYFASVMSRMEALTGESIRAHIVYKKSYAHSDFISDYHSFKGNAYGLANILRQTAFLKPSMKSKKVKNLYFAGQMTVPGPGIPPSILSGQIVAKQVIKEIRI